MLILFDPIILLLYPREKTNYEESFKKKKKLFMCPLYDEKLETIYTFNNKE